MIIFHRLSRVLCLAGTLASFTLQAAETAQNLPTTAKACLSDKSVMSGHDDWLFLMAELRHLSVGEFWGDKAAAVSKATKPDYADPLPAILDFKQQLEEAGVQLILLPVPTKASVYPEALANQAIAATAPPRGDRFQAEFYDILRQKGLTVIDLLPEMLAKRSDSAGPIYCKSDTHWAPAGIKLAAEAIGKKLANAAWLKDLPKVDSHRASREISFLGDLENMRGGHQNETLSLDFVGSDAQATSPIPTDNNSPILLLGDSHCLVFNAGNDMHASGAGLADQLADELGVAVDLIAVRGSGATPARINLMRRVRSDATYLAKKKVVIWCFTVREFTESSGWRLVPLSKK